MANNTLHLEKGLTVMGSPEALALVDGYIRTAKALAAEFKAMENATRKAKDEVRACYDLLAEEQPPRSKRAEFLLGLRDGCALLLICAAAVWLGRHW